MKVSIYLLEILCIIYYGKMVHIINGTYGNTKNKNKRKSCSFDYFQTSTKMVFLPKGNSCDYHSQVCVIFAH